MATKKDHQKILEVLSAQDQSGAFTAYVQVEGEQIADPNAFATALVLFQLKRFKGIPEVAQAISEGLDYLASCESPTRPGHFLFYPENNHPSWIGARLSPDVDDTSLILALLAEFHRITPKKIDDTIDHVLAPFRMLHGTERWMPWYRKYVYYTWLNELVYPNVIDCTVNINAGTLLWLAGRTSSPEFQAILDMLHTALEWAETSSERARLLSPYYVHPVETYYALKRGVESGVEDYRPLMQKIAQAPWCQAALRENQLPIFSSADGRITWTCQALDLARQFDNETHIL